MNDDQFEAPQVTDEGPPWKLIATLVLVGLLAIFFFQNGNKAQVDFLWLDGEWPIWAVIGISVLIGVALDRLISWQWRRARRRKANTS
jgi:uncharacterized integral membrane protein